MGIPWRKIGSGIKSGLKLGAMVNPSLAAVVAVIEGVERVSTSGKEKKTLVEEISDVILSSELANLTPEQEATIKAARSAFIDAYVAARNAEAAMDAAKDALLAAVASVKTSASSDGTGHP